MPENFFSDRLYQLRTEKNVSARDMSLSLGQNHGYINNIENGKNLPSMKMFFYICEYLDITPCEFFDTASAYPELTAGIINNLKKLNRKQLENIDFLIKEILHK